MKGASQMKEPAAAASTPIAPPLRSLPKPDPGEGPNTRTSLHAELVNPLSEKSWEETITRHREATIFHSTGWARVLAETYGHRPCYVQMSLNGNLLALIPVMEVQSVLTPSRGICLPFSDYCAPLLFSDFAGELVIEKLRQIARERRWKYFEIRSQSNFQAAAASETFCGHFLDLKAGWNALMSNFSSSVHRAVRKAQRSGLSVQIESGAHAMSKFYKLHVRTRRRHGVPPQPQSFFNNIERHLLHAGKGFIVVVELQQRPVAAAMFFRFGRHALYKFGASDERWQDLRPNNLAMSEGIKYLAGTGAEVLHFGRTEKDNRGLRRFKLSWGAAEEEIRYARFNMTTGSWKEPSAPGSGLHKHVFRILPASLNKMAGAMIYPHLD